MTTYRRTYPAKLESYRAWVNQPSTLQPDHRWHGKAGLVLDTGGDKVDLHFSDGPIHCIRIARSSLSTKTRGLAQ